MTVPDTDRLAELQSLTQDYSRYSRTAGGLSAVLGGSFCLLSYLLGATLPASLWLRIALIAIPMVWLALKHTAARRYQQRHGWVQELDVPRQVRIRSRLLIATSLVVAAVALGLVFDSQPFGEQAWTTARATYLVLILATPAIAWRFLHTPLDLVIGAFLLCQAAVAVRGSAYPLWSAGIVFVPAALLMIVAGIREHQKFRALELRIGELAKQSLDP